MSENISSLIDFKINVNSRSDGFRKISIDGNEKLNNLIRVIEKKSTFYEEDDALRLYNAVDDERDFELLKIWSKTDRQKTLNQLGFRPNQTYEVDLDNYPRASTPIQINVKRPWTIITSSADGPKIKVNENSGRIALDTTSWRKGQVKTKLTVIIHPIKDDGKEVPGKYLIRKFKFARNIPEVELDCEVGNDGIHYPILKTPEEPKDKGEDSIWTYPSETSNEVQPLGSQPLGSQPRERGENVLLAFQFFSTALSFGKAVADIVNLVKT